MGENSSQSLLDRVLILLPLDGAVREVKMFGGRSVMLENRMLVAVTRDGGLLVRVDPDRSAELLASQGAGQATMGAGRSMGPGWIAVSEAGVSTDGQLDLWVRVALEHHSKQTAPSPSSSAVRD